MFITTQRIIKSTRYGRGKTMELSQRNSLEGKIIGRIARRISGSEGTGKIINNENCEDNTRAMKRKMRWVVARRPVNGGGMRNSEFHEGVVEWIDDRDSLVPHQPGDVLCRRERKMGEVPCVIQR